MKIAVVRFPGTNNEYETIRALESFDVEAEILDHFQIDLTGNYDGFWIAGGFSYGDVLRAGAIASASNIMKEIIADKKPIIGVCNGFQILTETGKLPGALLPNTSTRFICKWIYLKVTDSDGIFSDLNGDLLKLPIAHFEGNYYLPSDQQAHSFVKYASSDGKIDPVFNPNGSVDNIAGVENPSESIFGLMPHPERASFKHQGSTDGRKIIEKFLQEVKS